MDFIGWFALGLLTAFVVIVTIWGRRQRGRRAEVARAWAKAHDFREIATDKMPFAPIQTLGKNRNLSAFRGNLGTIPTGVFQWKTTPRYGPVWIVCARIADPHPVLIRKRELAAKARLIGRGSPKGFCRVKVGDEAFDRGLAIDIPSSTSVDDALPPSLRKIITKISPWTYVVRSDGLVAVFVQEFFVKSTDATLDAGLRILKAALAAKA